MSPTPRKRRRAAEAIHNTRSPGSTPGRKRNAVEAVNLTSSLAPPSSSPSSCKGSSSIAMDKAAAPPTSPQPLKSCFKSPAKVYAQRVRSATKSKPYDPSNQRTSIPSPSTPSLVDKFSSLSIWDNETGALHTTVSDALQNWRSKYALHEEVEQSAAEGDPLVKTHIDTSGGSTAWPKSGDIFSGTFSTVNPAQSDKKQSPAVEESDTKLVTRANSWRCVMCLEENDIENTNCSICKRLRLRHNY